ncbi:MAG: hypothetical protein A3C58_01475 [Candidatus Staskawiczbacteria bacterium RIFCSPHIGHO2_02_FULL_34_10]|uniref:Uncharacterized protein n=1 Tax=Candidatus Staskawiczbacteria bacterium RIFCSPHIGHO2_02_FULL_34_10 TaxID=1802205 RepID=A0A1G2HVE6_9BACT|nr:MAG: hypothetical protein A3C58_01475 [Candidatus Staskawiczbacteria bacterium RIFCSPHIGHO2_02_FULL_34_10]
MKNVKDKNDKKIIYIAKMVELPRNDGVDPLSNEINTFFKRLKYCTMANADAKNPVANKIRNNFSHWFLLIKIVKRTEKIKKNKRFSTPPDLVGDPNMLKLTSCENKVDRITVVKNPPRSSMGRYTDLSHIGNETERFFL